MRAAVGAVITTLVWFVVLGCGPAYGSYNRTYLPRLGDYNVAKAINNRGQVLVSGDLGLARLWQEGTYTPLGIALPNCISDQGQIVGYTDFPPSAAVTWSNGTMVPLALPVGAGASRAFSINNSGDIVGDCVLADSSQRAVLWHGGVLRGIGGTGTTAYCINDIGQVVGESWASGPVRATLWQGGMTTYLPPLTGYANSRAYHIKNHGVAVGVSFNGTYNRATLWQGGLAIDLGSLGGEYSWAYCINDSGDVVGESVGSGQVRRATLWTNGGMTDLSTGLSGPTVALAINDVGQIVGSYTPNLAYPACLAVLWQPVPEPASAVALLSGLAGAIFALPRRRKQGN